VLPFSKKEMLCSLVLYEIEDLLVVGIVLEPYCL
jgi:hypothetical protein